MIRTLQNRASALQSLSAWRRLFILCTFLVVALSSLLTSAHVAGAQEPPPPTVAVVIDTVTYDSVNDRYLMAISLMGTTQISKLVIIVKEMASGTDVKTVELSPGGQLLLRPELTTETLRDGQQYEIRILALDPSGARLLRPSDDSGDVDIADQSIWATYSFTYLPQGVNPMGFSVLSVNVDYQRDVLEINVAPDGSSTPDKYGGFIVNEGGQQVAAIPLGVYTESPIVLPIPSAMRVPGEVRKYTLTLTMEDTNGNNAEEAFSFAPTPPPRVGPIQRLTGALTENPMIPAMILVVIFSAGMVHMIRTMPKAPKKEIRPPIETIEVIPEPRIAPPAPRPVAGPVRPTPTVRARLRVLESPGMSSGRDKSVVLPFTLGRQEFPNDRQISREHARVELQQGKLVLIDLGSMNGTFVDEQRLAPREPTPIGRSMRVRLGASTLCELTLES